MRSNTLSAILAAAGSISGVAAQLFPNSSTTAAPSPTPNFGGNPERFNGFQFLGCIGSKSNHPTFDLVRSSDTMDLAQCTTLCAGKTYIGLFLRDCYCGDALVDVGSNLVAADRCSLPCPGNSQQRCGGFAPLVVPRNVEARAAPNTILLTVYVFIDLSPGATITLPQVTQTLTLTTTVTGTITSCAPAVTGCQLGGVTTEIRTITTTYCPTCQKKPDFHHKKPDQCDEDYDCDECRDWRKNNPCKGDDCDKHGNWKGKPDHPCKGDDCDEHGNGKGKHGNGKGKPDHPCKGDDCDEHGDWKCKGDKGDDCDDHGNWKGEHGKGEHGNGKGKPDHCKGDDCDEHDSGKGKHGNGKGKPDHPCKGDDCDEHGDWKCKGDKGDDCDEHGNWKGEHDNGKGKPDHPCKGDDCDKDGKWKGKHGDKNETCHGDRCYVVAGSDKSTAGMGILLLSMILGVGLFL